ncbi:tetratricopeptide repeat protein [Rasiella sp. SM2506]|uniref:tetratricopeptide repeat protein n=1 Tax=Rasiella sp. SM2506 TaxID=3423914 RepID=UPI003D7A8949
MATYKKRGYKQPKPKNETDQDGVFDGDSTTAEVFNTLDEGANKTEAWVEKNQKGILIVVGIIAVAVLGYLGFQQWVQGPKEAEAMNEMFQAQQYFEQALGNETVSDSLYDLSLNGGRGKYGFLEIIDNYGSTKAGNLAEYYAGMAYLSTGKYQEAINHLDNFSSEDEMLAPLAKGAIGDAFAQLNQNEEALKYYEAAATVRTNEVTSPRFLLKAGIVAMNLGKTDAALKHFETLNKQYPKSTEAKTSIPYKGKVEAMQ